VPVSTIPAVLAKIDVVPYVTAWLMPRYSDAGDTVVIGVYVIADVYFVASVPPKVSSPLVIELTVVGAKNTLRTLEEMVP
jgi:hypothetical protein